MQIDLFQVDAFTNQVFGGNPAAVCPLETWLPDKVLQNIAIENNLSETAFFIPSAHNNADFDLRWMTPSCEVDLCGHATLATAFTIFNHLNFTKDTIRFSSRSGILNVTKTNIGYTLNFPLWTEQPLKFSTQDLENTLGVTVLETYQSTKTFAVLENAEDVIDLTPNFAKINTLKDTKGLVITAQNTTNNKFDFTSRLFAPQIGIDEDPVTGAIHCFLTPYWAQRLNKTKLNAHQASARGGKLYCELKDDRVEITGNAVLYMKGTISV